MDFKQIIELIKTVDDSDIADFKLKEGDLEIRISSGKFINKEASKVVQTVQSPPMVSVSHEEAVSAKPEHSLGAVPPKAAPPDLPASTKSEESTAGEENLLEVKSPIVGTFYRSAGPDKPPYVKVGDTIAKGDVVCIVEAMKLFNEIESEIGGKIVKVLVEDAAPVEYDQPLFLVEPA